MSAFFSAPKAPPPVERLVRPQARLDLILSEDQFTGQIDVRGSLILDVSSDQVIVAQTDPPILQSMTGREVEASLVHRHAASGDTRWSWAATIEGLSHGYRLNPDDPNSSLVSVILLSRPGKPKLEKRNIRQAYRFEVGLRDGITVRLDPALAPVNLLNFSSGGLLLSTRIPPAYTFGQELGFELSFPDDLELPEKHIQGRASVVRLEFEGQFALMGLKFQDLSRDDLRAMHRIINYYMLAEQRRRNRYDAYLGKHEAGQERLKTEPPEQVQPTHFFMSAPLDSTRLNQDARKLLEEVINHFMAVPDARIDVSLEVNITAPDGLPQPLVKTVSENCRTLKVKTFGFDG